MSRPAISCGATPAPASEQTRRPLGFLAWIATYKLIKAILAIGGAFLVLYLRRNSIPDVIRRSASGIGLDPDGALTRRVAHFLLQFDPAVLRSAVWILVGYAVLYCVEAVGLLMEKLWAEWLTIVQTSLLIPFEIQHLIRRPTPLKFVLLWLSVGMVVYLLWRIRRDSMAERTNPCVEPER